MDDVAHIAHDMTVYSDMLLSDGLLHVKGGNYSARVGDDLIITRTGSFKNDLVPERLIRAPIYADEPVTNASSVLSMHRAIYRKTDAKAVMHSHPYHPTLLSFLLDEFSPLDENGLMYLGKTIRVIEAPDYKVWSAADEGIADALVDSNAAILKWHGAFTKGATMADALHNSQAIESAARYYLDLWKMVRDGYKPTLAKYIQRPTWWPSED